MVEDTKLVRFDFRCPDCGRDGIVVAPSNASHLRCGLTRCAKWHSVLELRLLNDAFAPPANAGYTGAVCVSDPKPGDVPDYGRFEAPS